MFGEILRHKQESWTLWNKMTSKFMLHRWSHIISCFPNSFWKQRPQIVLKILTLKGQIEDIVDKHLILNKMLNIFYEMLHYLKLFVSHPSN